MTTPPGSCGGTLVTGESVLIIEENGIIAFYICEILERAGYIVEDPVTSGEDALARLASEPLPGLLLLDTGVPGRSGNFSELHRICSQENVPVVILTTFSDHSDAGQVPGICRAVFLTMPFSERELLVSVKKILHVARCSPEPRS
jgi:DNA-binding response OmpR family regulator